MKKFIALLTVFVTLAVAVPTFAKSKEITCGICYGTGKCKTCAGRGFCMVLQFRTVRDKNGRRYNQPYQARIRCSVCHGGKKCSNCLGKGKKMLYY